MNLVHLLYKRSAVFVAFGAAFWVTRLPDPVQDTDIEKSPE